MTRNLLFSLLLLCPVCEGQSVLTEGAPTPGAAAAGIPLQAVRQAKAAAVPPTAVLIESAPTVPAAPQTAAASRLARPLAASSEFEQFAEDAIGRKLPVYGRELFDEVPSTFSPVERVPVPADYVLGPGDELLIRAWGKIDLDLRATIDRNGQVFLPRVGALTVAGLRSEQVEGYLRNAIGTLFKDFELNVALGQLRSIQIFVLGDARQPGAYTVSSFSTLVDALFASGGPSSIGTMRRIQLRRPGRPPAEFDIYDLAQKGDKSRDIRLLPGDVIYIPPAGSQIAIAGSVKVPGIYELKGETTVASALEGAGGLTSLAGAGRVLLERIDNHLGRKVEEFALNEDGLRRPLADGDLLRVFPLSPRFENAVTLKGSVARPGRYVWKQGMRVSDLIPCREFLVTRDYWNLENHQVGPESERPFGTSSKEQSEEGRGQVIGSIGQNNAEINWEYAVIERLDGKDLSTRLIPFRLASAIENPASGDNQPLEAGDVVAILSRADLELPMEQHAAFVRVGGEVNAPGIYRVTPAETLRDVVDRAGGLTAHSYLYASRFTRTSTRRAEEEQLRQSSEQMQRELTAHYARSVPSTAQGAAEVEAQMGMQQAAIAGLVAVKPTGRVVLDMQPNAAAVGDIPALPLEDGDAYYIPPRLSTVQVAGAVYNPSAFQYQPETRLLSYLRDAGGPTRDADTRRIFLIRADGTVISRQSRHSGFRGDFEALKLLPGDSIVVPERLKAPGGIRGFQELTQVVSQAALTAAALGAVLP